MAEQAHHGSDLCTDLIKHSRKTPFRVGSDAIHHRTTQHDKICPAGKSFDHMLAGTHAAIHDQRIIIANRIPDRDEGFDGARGGIQLATSMVRYPDGVGVRRLDPLGIGRALHP